MDKFCSPYNFTTDWNAENHDGLPSNGWYLPSGHFMQLLVGGALVVKKWLSSGKRCLYGMVIANIFMVLGIAFTVNYCRIQR